MVLSKLGKTLMCFKLLHVSLLAIFAQLIRSPEQLQQPTNKFEIDRNHNSQPIKFNKYYYSIL